MLLNNLTSGPLGLIKPTIVGDVTVNQALLHATNYQVINFPNKHFP